MKLIDWILLLAVVALLVLAFYLANHRSGSCHGCDKNCCGKNDKETCQKCGKDG